jgi:CarboxypepD_reg-like domain
MIRRAPTVTLPPMRRPLRTAFDTRNVMRTLALLCALAACQAARGTPRAGVASAAAVATLHPDTPHRVEGVLVDSLLTDNVLRGALLALDGVARVTMTTDAGTFAFDSVLPGRHRLVVRHPLLDSLGIDTVGVELRIGDDEQVGHISLPTAQQYANRRCGNRGTSATDGLVLGVVRDALTDEPITDAEVLASWRGSDSAFAGSGLRIRARSRTTVDGQFAICNAPRFTPIDLWARQVNLDTPHLRIQLGAAIIGAYDISVESALLAVDTTAPGPAAVRGAGVIAGRILTTSEDGLPDVTVQLDDTEKIVVTDADGRFTIRDVPPGVRTLDIRAIGFRPMRIGVNLRASQRFERSITLDRRVAVLGTVTVRSNAAGSWDSLSFDGRRKRGSGYFFTQESLRGISDLGTALRLVPGIRGRSNERTQRLVAGRGAGCFPAFVVNGVRFESGGDIGPEALIRASDVRAMEAYTSRLSTPPEFQRFSDCAVIVIWLRDLQLEREAERRRKTP